jgi:ABC-2 type transport system permease protein
MQLATAVGLWVAAQATMGGFGDMLSASAAPPLAICLAAALNYLPAMLLFAGLAVLLVGLLPRFSNVIWAWLAFSFVASFLGSMLSMPEWLEKLSPFSLLPRYPVDAADPALTAVLMAAAGALAVIGIAAYRHRDLGMH